MDWIINDELGLTVGHLVGWTAASFMVVGGIIPYIPQYREIKQTQDPDGFSLHVCLSLLVANTLRIFFWFASRYELPLLVQSIVMNITMFLMVHLCVNVRRRNAIMRTRERVFSGDDLSKVEGNRGSINKTIVVEDHNMNDASNSASTNNSSLKKTRSKHYICDFDPRYFWQWTDFQSYLDFMLVFWMVGAVVTYLMLNVNWFMETIGFLAVFTEAMLGAPQFVRNYKNKSTHGMSICMVVMWTAGDMFKTAYFLVRNAPTQFWICGTLQVTLDLAILLQVYIYRNNPQHRNTQHGD